MKWSTLYGKAGECKKHWKGGGGSSSTTVKQDSTPWKPQQDYLTSGFQKAADWANSTPRQYGGQWFAPVNAQQQGAWASLAGEQDNANRAASLTGTAVPLLQQVANRNNAFSMNPYTQQAIAATLRPVQQQFSEQVLPQLRGSAIAAGGDGGSRQGIAEGLATRSLNQQMLDTTAQMQNQAWQFGQQQQLQNQAQSLQAAGMLPQIAAQQFGLQQEGVNAAIQAGNLQQAAAQAQLDAQKAQWDFNRQLPADTLQQYMGLIRGNYGGSGTSAQSVSNPYSTLYGLAGAGMLGMQAYGQGVQNGWWGGAGGASGAQSAIGGFGQGMNSLSFGNGLLTNSLMAGSYNMF